MIMDLSTYILILWSWLLDKQYNPFVDVYYESMKRINWQAQEWTQGAFVNNVLFLRTITSQAIR